MKVYEVSRSTIPIDPKLIACAGETQLPNLWMSEAQPAVDAAREFVRDYPGPGLPRARVTRVVPGYRNERNAPKLIFFAWRNLEGTYMEQRA